MAYQVYFADLTDENHALILALLRLKEESGRLEPSEEELLAKIRQEFLLVPQAEFSEIRAPAPPPRQAGRRSFSRRGAGNGRGHQGNGDRG